MAGAASPDAGVASGRFRIWMAGIALLALIVGGGTIVITRAASARWLSRGCRPISSRRCHMSSARR